MSALDTPARASRASRPQTRNWRRLISDASTKSSTAAEHRAELRRHLEAAAELASRRRVAPLAPHQILDDDSAKWDKRVEALRDVAKTPASCDMRIVARHLIKDIANLRAQLVIQAADTIVAVKPLLTDDEAESLFHAAAAGVIITKKIMADARRRAALVIVEGRTDSEFWQSVLSKIEEDAPAIRKLVLDAVELFVEREDESTVRDVVEAVLSHAAPDRTPEVREAARKLFRGYAAKYGNKAAKSLLEALPRDARERLATKKKAAERKTMKQIMQERRAALKKGKREAENPKVSDAKRVAFNDQENLENGETV